MSKNIELNIYDNILTPKISKKANKITIERWFDMIKFSEYSSDIIKARKAGKYTTDYDEIKNDTLAVTYNFNFTKHKNNDNIAGATGLMYIDVDPPKDKPFDFNINMLDTTKVFAYHKSFGGNGYVIIVQVRGLSTDKDTTNFKPTYLSILNELGLAKYYDPNAVKATQYNVLSYDPDIFINYDSLVFNAIDEVNENFNSITNDENESHIEEIKKKKIYTQIGDSFSPNQAIRFSNITDYNNIDSEFITDWDGIDIIKCYLPYNSKILEGKRNSTLLSYCNNLVWLNPQLTPAGAITIMKNVNTNACSEPLPEHQIKSIVNSIFKYKVAGTLQPKLQKKKRKIIFANHSELTGKEKFSIAASLVHEHKRDLSKQKIYECLENWEFNTNGKITIRAIVKVAKMSYKTVVKYWSEFKDYAAELNLENGKIKTKRKDSAMRSAHDKESDFKPLQRILPIVDKELSDVKLDDAAGFKVANYSLYKRAVSIIETTPLIMIHMRLAHLIKTGFNGIETIPAGGFQFTFIIHPATNTVQFISIADGDDVLLQAA